MSTGLTAAVLAGGRSRRMGRDKALLTIDGVPLLQRTIATTDSLCVRGLIVSNNPAAHGRFAWPTVPDRFPETGPLGGLATALFHSTTPYVLLLACDMPNLSTPLLRYIIDRQSDAFQAVIPDSPHGLQPLCALYNRSILLQAEAAIRQQRLSMRAFVSQLTACVVSPQDWMPLSEGVDPFLNLNTPEEYRSEQKKAPGV